MMLLQWNRLIILFIRLVEVCKFNRQASDVVGRPYLIKSDCIKFFK